MFHDVDARDRMLLREELSKYNLFPRRGNTDQRDKHECRTDDGVCFLACSRHLHVIGRGLCRRHVVQFRFVEALSQDDYDSTEVFIIGTGRTLSEEAVQHTPKHETPPLTLCPSPRPLNPRGTTWTERRHTSQPLFPCDPQLAALLTD